MLARFRTEKRRSACEPLLTSPHLEYLLQEALPRPVFDQVAVLTDRMPELWRPIRWCVYRHTYYRDPRIALNNTFLQWRRRA